MCNCASVWVGTPDRLIRRQTDVGVNAIVIVYENTMTDILKNLKLGSIQNFVPTRKQKMI